MGVCTKERKGVKATVLMATPCKATPEFIARFIASLVYCRSAAAQHVYARAQSADRGAAAQTDNGQSRRARTGGRRRQRHEGHLRRQGVRVALRTSAPRAVCMVHCASCWVVAAQWI